MTYKHVLLGSILWLLSSVVSFAQSDVRYTVKPGDTLYSISREFDIEVDELRKLNGLETGSIRAGIILIIKKGEVEEEQVFADPEPTIEPTDPLIKLDPQRGAAGESVESLAQKLGLTSAELRSINPEIDVVVETHVSLS